MRIGIHNEHQARIFQPTVSHYQSQDEECLFDAIPLDDSKKGIHHHPGPSHMFKEQGGIHLRILLFPLKNIPGQKVCAVFIRVIVTEMPRR